MYGTDDFGGRSKRKNNGNRDLKLYSMKVCAGFIWLKIRWVAGACVRCKETSAANIC
jgi:hypothetical protein